MGSELHFCFSVTLNYIHFAEIVINSIKRHNPNSKATILVIDEIPEEVKNHFNKQQIDILDLDKINIPNLEKIKLYFNNFELCNAARPWLILYLIKQMNAEKVIYIDADTYVTGSFEHISQLLDHHAFAYTPHVISDLPIDDKLPNQNNIGMAGELNSGFYAFRACSVSENALKWLGERILIYGFDSVRDGMFVDQKLLVSLALKYWDDFYLITHPGYNVAYWNLHERNLRYENDRYYIGEHPLVFFHFSGFTLDHPDKLSKHCNRYVNISESTVLLKLVSAYLNEFSKVTQKNNKKNSGQLIFESALLRRFYFKYGVLPRFPEMFKFFENVANYLDIISHKIQYGLLNKWIKRSYDD